MSSVTEKIIKGVAFESASNFAIKIIAIISYLLIIRHLSVHDYGLFVLLTSFSVPSVAFVFFGFDRIFVSVVAKARGDGNRGLVKSMLIEYFGSVLLLTVIGLLIFFLVKNTISSHYALSLDQFFFPIAFFVISQIAMNAILLLFESHENFGSASLLKSLEALIRASIVGALFYYSRETITAANLLLIYGASKYGAVLFGLPAFIHIFGKAIHRSIIRDKKTIIGIIKEYGKWEMARIIADQLLGTLKIWLIKFFVNVESVGIYDFAQNINSAVINFLPIKGIIFPVVQRVIDKKEVVRLVLLKAKKYTFLFYLLSYIGLVLTLPSIVSLLAPQYVNNLLLVYVVLLDLFVTVYTIGQGSLIYGYKLQKFLLTITPITYFVDVVSYISLTYFFGLFGPVISNHIKTLFTGKIINRHLEKEYGVKGEKLSDFFTFDEYDRLILKRVKEAITDRVTKFTK